MALDFFETRMECGTGKWDGGRRGIEREGGTGKICRTGVQVEEIEGDD